MKVSFVMHENKGLKVNGRGISAITFGLGEVLINPLTQLQRLHQLGHG
jgi:hypothetical protein